MFQLASNLIHSLSWLSLLRIESHGLADQERTQFAPRALTYWTLGIIHLVADKYREQHLSYLLPHYHQHYSFLQSGLQIIFYKARAHDRQHRANL